MPFGKRLDGPGGRRGAARAPLVLRAAMTTQCRSQTVVLLDVSQTGAKLTCPDVPPVGTDVLVRIGPLEAFATVVWAEIGDCGVNFEASIGIDEVELLRREGGPASLCRFDPDRALAAEDWASGLAR